MLIRTLLVILQTATSAVVFSFVFLFGGVISPVFLVFSLISATGIVAGRFSRQILKANSHLLQFLVALASLFAALFALDYFSDGVLGISYLAIYQAEFDPMGTIQFGIGFISMWLALAAWRKPKVNGAVDELPHHPTPRSYHSPEMQMESQSPSANVRVDKPRTKRVINWFSARSSTFNEQL